MKEQDELAVRELYADLTDHEILIRHAILLHAMRDVDRPPCAKLKRLVGNGRFGMLHYLFVWMALLTLATCGKDVIAPLIKVILAML